MRLKGRENAAAVKLMRRIAEAAAVPPKGVWRFLGKTIRGWLWGSRGRQGPEGCMPYHTEIRLLFGGDCAPALIPLVQPGKGREARSVAERPDGFLTFLISSGRKQRGIYAALPFGIALQKDGKGTGP
jgi:hypothetical protein